ARAPWTRAVSLRARGSASSRASSPQGRSGSWTSLESSTIIRPGASVGSTVSNTLRTRGLSFWTCCRGRASSLRKLVTTRRVRDMDEVLVRATLRLKAPSSAAAVEVVKGFLLRGTFWEGLDEAGHEAGVSMARVERVVADVEAEPSDAYMAWLMKRAKAVLVLTAHLRNDPVRHAAAL